METKMLDLLVASELAECDRMLQRLEDDYNRPERVARRERIAAHIGRPLCMDEELTASLKKEMGKI